MNELEFSVRGLPIAQGSARAFVAKGRAIITTDANRTNTPLGAWRTSIAAAASEAMHQAPALTGPVMVIAHFVFPRPKGHYWPISRRRQMPELRLDAPRFMVGKPDLDKLERALLDGITNVVVRDDSQVAGLQAWKVYEDDKRRPGVQVRITEGKATR